MMTGMTDVGLHAKANAFLAILSEKWLANSLEPATTPCWYCALKEKTFDPKTPAPPRPSAPWVLGILFRMLHSKK